ncbi:MAG: type II toxin-antitoxin system HicB family antitoxin [Methanosarcinaceae archaeon]|jgi:predicted RNase H-like HicB family nuclease|nr:type II toxin-antitoxin system HicB family antitoxin [Methanosarcinaceae archaeon]NKQ39927.1 type II toxin-antitoxin system HicB family antitoxin [Methanosarcinales archaeon]
MIIEYIKAALSKAKFEIIEDEEPYYGEVCELEGVWATGKTLDECRKNLAEVVDGWIVVRLRKGLPIPQMDAYNIEELSRLDIGVKI